jgi:fibronectin type 3 domain-containing protein
MSVSKHQHWICLGLMMVLLCCTSIAQENTSDTTAEAINTTETPVHWSNLPHAIPSDKSSVYATVGIIRTEYQPVSKFDKIVTYITRKTGLSSKYELRTGFVGFSDKMVITSSNILLDNQGVYLHNSYTWHPQYASNTPPESQYGIPLRSFIILSQHKGYAEALDDSNKPHSNFAIAIAAEKLTDNLLPTINFERNQKLFWSDTPKGIVGYYSEMYPNLLNTPNSLDAYRLHQSTLTRAPTQPTALYAMELLDCETCHALNQPFLHAFPSTVGSPVFVEIPDRGFIICGLVTNSIEPKLNKDNTQSGQTFIHYFTPQDKELLDNYHPNILSLSETLDNEPPQVESLQSSNIVQYQSVHNVQLARDHELLQPYLTWEGLEHTNDYVVFRTETPLLSGKPEEFMASVTDTKFIDTTADIFKTYYYWVCAHYTNPHELLTYPSGPHKLAATPYPEAPELKASEKVAYELSWTALPYSENLISYKIHRTTNNSPEDPIITETVEPHFTDSTAKATESYTYWVTSQLHTFETQPSNLVTIDVIPPLSQGPQNIRVHPWIPNQLTWNSVDGPYITYFIYGSNVGAINNVDIKDTDFIGKTQDTFFSMDPDTTEKYNHFIVFAQNPGNIASGNVTAIDFKPLTLKAPANLQLSNPIKRRITWNIEPYTYVKEFVIYRREKNSSEPATVIAHIQDNVFEDTSAEKNKTYIYQVQAFNAVTESPLSKELEVCFDCIE